MRFPLFIHMWRRGQPLYSVTTKDRYILNSHQLPWPITGFWSVFCNTLVLLYSFYPLLILSPSSFWKVVIISLASLSVNKEREWHDPLLDMGGTSLCGHLPRLLGAIRGLVVSTRWELPLRDISSFASRNWSFRAKMFLFVFGFVPAFTINRSGNVR